MRKAIPPLFLLASVFVWVACDTEQPTAPGDLDSSFNIVDATTNPADFPNFFWLPPMVDNPTTTGTFIGTIDPTVVICTWVGNFEEPCSPKSGNHDIWVFSANTSPDGVTVNQNGQHYQLNWNTTDFQKLGITNYRIAVWLENHNLGWADVELLENGAGFKNLEDQVIGLIDGRTLPIKFRVEAELCATHPEACPQIWDLLFQSDRNGNFDLFVKDLESGIEANLTFGYEGLDGTGNWHPMDNTKIIFASDRGNEGGQPFLYTMTFTPEGLNTQPLGVPGWQPEYSPDGSKVVFQRGWPPQPEWPNSGCDPNDEEDPCGREHDIWIMDAEGSTQVQLTDVPFDIGGNGWDWIDLYEDWSPTWDPTGNWVTFGRSRNGSDYEAHVPGWLDCDGHTIPDGMTWEFFWNNRRAFCYFDLVSIDVSDLDLNNPTPWFELTWVRHTYDLGVDQLGPKWSPEGMLTYKEGASDGKIVALDILPEDYTYWPTPSRDLTLSNESGDISWSPNGTEVVFGSERSGFAGIYYVSSWAGWLGTGPGFLQDPLVVEPGDRNDFARWRPGSH